MTTLEDDWTPKRNGKYYCSQRCGGGTHCLHVEYEGAIKRAEELAAQMGNGWQPHVWENLGWHYSVTFSESCIIHCYVDRNKPREDDGHFPRTNYWCDMRLAGRQFETKADTPEDAYGFTVQDARTFAARINQDLKELIEAGDND